MHLLGDEVLICLHRPNPRERVVHGVLGVESTIGDFEGGVGVGCEELDEGTIGIPRPEIHRVDVNVGSLIWDIIRLHVEELFVELPKALLLLFEEPNPEWNTTHRETTWG